MSVSGVLVIASPAQQETVPDAIDALGWAEVHQTDGAGRLIVTIEAASSEEGLERLKRVQRIPGVLSVAMVIHCFEDEQSAPATPAEAIAAGLEDDTLSQRSHYSRLKAWSNF